MPFIANFSSQMKSYLYHTYLMPYVYFYKVLMSLERNIRILFHLHHFFFPGANTQEELTGGRRNKYQIKNNPVKYHTYFFHKVTPKNTDKQTQKKLNYLMTAHLIMHLYGLAQYRGGVGGRGPYHSADNHRPPKPDTSCVDAMLG